MFAERDGISVGNQTDVSCDLAVLACGGLVHPSDERSPAAWCARCGQVAEAQRDGG